jgi:adenosylcobinamide hydrolase
MNWERLAETTQIVVRRSGRFLVADLLVAHEVLSTSVVNGGQAAGVRHLVNHQSCEATAHAERHRLITEQGLAQYHDHVCAEVGLPAAATALMGTAANMNYAALTTAVDKGVEVTAIVTAGVEGNATCAGDPANWREAEAGMERIPAYAGTINTILLINTPITPSTLARTVVTMTEGKSAALARLTVPSRYSSDLATGTGTDQYCLAAPRDGQRLLTSASPHVKLGELIGSAVRDATIEALRWQNGLEPSYTRGLFHALGRHGLKEATFFDDIAVLLDSSEQELLRKNSKAVLYEPLVGAAAHAMAAVLDRIRHGALPASVASDALVQQAASMAATVAARADRWPEFRAVLHAPAMEGVRPLVLAAIALGWREKWRSN